MILADLTDRIEHLRVHTSMGGDSVVVIGITGAPGAGKTTLAESLVSELNGDEADPERQLYAHVPMDGFHLADAELDRLGLLDRKGAPETFDSYGYAALLSRLSEPRNAVVYAPGFERTLEQPLAGVIPVYPSVQVVITEGNYLLLDRPGWREVRQRCTETWFCEQEQRLRIERLVQRHILFGKSPEAAASWVETVDEPNARLIEATRSRADLVVRVG
ncbi:nucleoside/nucleotide kinase family protein [Arthrobacter sp. JZ12]|uniref:nucleoside/nucleotide kinase family protein n=1 Tax=Arthrobacter sp. JZ12 TaxID=2654190 RepID=UPI002B4A1CF5|nr:nucleoside/nucleotide kinase family protein [Arthrobacter sp. JZ12]